jgi:hypothetical protein
MEESAHVTDRTWEFMLGSYVRGELSIGPSQAQIIRRGSAHRTNIIFVPAAALNRKNRNGGFMKTDKQLQQDVLEELQYEPSVDASKIGVIAHNGIVSLSGTVASYAEQYGATHAAERVAGVKAVANETKVELPFHASA